MKLFRTIAKKLGSIVIHSNKPKPTLPVKARIGPPHEFELVAASLLHHLSPRTFPSGTIDEPTLLRLCYLVDWRLTIRGHEPFTGLTWIHNQTYPVNTFALLRVRESDIVQTTKDEKGQLLVKLRHTLVPPLPDHVQNAIRHVATIANQPDNVDGDLLDLSVGSSWPARDAIRHLTMSTYPFMALEHGDSIDLMECARLYRQDFPNARAFTDVAMEGPVFGTVSKSPDHTTTSIEVTA